MSENQKQKRILMIASLVVLTLVLGVSFAYFLAQGQSTEQSITTSNMGVEFDDGTAIVNAEGLKPIMRDEVLTKAAKKTFTVTNTGTEKMYIHLTLEDVVIPTTLQRYDFVWSLYEGDTNVSNGTFASATTSMDIAPYQVFEVGEDKTYSLYMWIDETGIDQSSMMGQTFKATIKAEGEVYWTSPESDFVVNANGVLTTYNGDDTTIVIPPVVNGTTVKEISGIIPDSSAWAEANITLVIPNTVTKLGDLAFFDGNIENIIIPNSVTYIGIAALTSNADLNLSLPNSITYIGSEALSSNKFTGLFIPNSVTTIDDWAIGDNNLQGIVIPSSVTSIKASEATGIFASSWKLNENLLISVQGRNSAPDTFDEGWNRKVYEDTEMYNVVYVK